RAANSGRPDGNVIPRRSGNLLVQDDVGDLQPTAGLQDPIGLSEHRHLVRGEIDHAVRDDEIDALIRYWQRLREALPVLHLLEADEGDALPTEGQHGGRHVHGYDPPPRPPPPRTHQRIPATPP